jgi:hypothetical protein
VIIRVDNKNSPNSLRCCAFLFSIIARGRCHTKIHELSVNMMEREDIIFLSWHVTKSVSLCLVYCGRHTGSQTLRSPFPKVSRGTENSHTGGE